MYRTLLFKLFRLDELTRPRTSLHKLIFAITFCVPVLVAAEISPTNKSAPFTNQEFKYIAKPGDTLLSISQKLLQKPKDWVVLQQINNIPEPNRLQPQQIIRIPFNLLKSRSIQAEILSQDGQVNLTKTNTGFSEASKIQTGVDGFVQIRLPDGSILNIPPTSEIQMRKLRRYKRGPALDTHIRIIQGRVETQVSKQIPKSRFIISSPMVIASVRGTNFRVRFDPQEGATSLEVEEGRVAFSPITKRAKKNKNPHTVDVLAGFGALADTHGTITPPIPLLPAPSIPPAQLRQEKLTLNFRPEPIAGIQSYRLSVAEDQAFGHILFEKVINFSEAEFKFPAPADGNYWLRIRGIDTNGLEGQVAQLAFIVAARPEPPLLRIPVTGTKARQSSLTFVWAEQDQANYHLQIARDPEFNDRIMDLPLTTAKYTQRLSPGSYYWRVATIIKDRQGPWSQSQIFHLFALPTDLLPVVDDGKTLSLEWRAEAGQIFELQIATDPEFKQLMLERTLSQTRFQFPRPAPGNYYARYRAIDTDGYIGPYTTPQKIRVDMRWQSNNGEPIQSISGALSPTYP